MAANSLTRSLLLATLTLRATTASALDKQGSAHGGSVAGESDGVALTGSALAGVAAYNPSYTARPNNTGRALLRFAGHFDLDLIGERLSIPIDLNFFTDRQRPGANKLVPSEFDFIGGLTSTWPLSRSHAIELGTRFERDMPVDRSKYAQSYVDARLRLLGSLASQWPALGRALHDGDIAETLTLGWFVWNPSYAARPDNTGKALLRYGGNLGINTFHHRVGLGIDAVCFTDRERSALAVSELDFTPELVIRPGLVEVHLAYERDMPIDRGAFVQQLALLYVSTSFEIWTNRGKPDSNPSEPLDHVDQ